MNREDDDSSASDTEYARKRSLRGTASPTITKRARHSPQPPSHNGHPSALRPLSLSILGVEPIDEFIREVADWIHGVMNTRPPEGQIEVEAKLGWLRFKDSGQRMNHPLRVETILFHDDSYRFESNMSIVQHKHFNQLLNSLEASSRQPSHPTSPLRYAHLRLIDTFYPTEGSGKIRVTRDEKTGEVKEIVKKVRLGDLEIYSPKRFVDWRISVNVEIPVQHPIGTAIMTRRKDRLSYTHEEFNIDLTQVTQTTTPNSQPQVMHELELEFARPAVLLSTAAMRGDPQVSEHERNAFDELIRAFVNNIRILVRNAAPTPP